MPVIGVISLAESLDLADGLTRRLQGLPRLLLPAKPPETHGPRYVRHRQAVPATVRPKCETVVRQRQGLFILPAAVLGQRLRRLNPGPRPVVLGLGLNARFVDHPVGPLEFPGRQRKEEASLRDPLIEGRILLRAIAVEHWAAQATIALAVAQPGAQDRPPIPS